MSALFEFFLSVGARDFLPHYRELKAQGKINPAVVSYYLKRFMLYSLLGGGIAVGLMWVMGGITIGEETGLTFNFNLTIPLIFGIFIALYLWWTMIEMVGVTIHVYSRGRVAKATVMGTKSRMGRGFNVLHRFEIDGRVIETSFGKQIGQKSYWDSYAGKDLEIIYAEDNPEVTMEFKEALFAERCLDKTRLEAPR